MAKPTSVTPWTYTRAKSFLTCPKQFYHEHVLKEFPFKETPETRYGNELHKACELYVKRDVPLEGRFQFLQPALDKFKAMPGEKHCEIKMGLTEALDPCSFFDKAVWFRGIADLIIVDGDVATVVDYKSGKSARYADPGQLELMALAVFKHFPAVQTVRAGLLFVVAKALVKEKYPVDRSEDLWAKWLGVVHQMEEAHRLNMWSPRPSGLCAKYCPVLECPHNGRG
jgi:hypothetical protein